MNAQTKRNYRDAIQLVATEKCVKDAEARIKRFERAHDEWRRLMGLEPLPR